jgi:hypothetical protein
MPDDHVVRATFLALAERGLEQTDIRDEASIRYISDLMTQFMRTEDLYCIRNERGRRLEHVADLLAAAEKSPAASTRKDHYRYLGDFTLFMLGLFPERLDSPRRPIGAGYYTAQGRRSYNIVADLAWTDAEPDLLRRLSERFEQYVCGMNWGKLYTHDPFF